ncbi:hypothetical protein ACFFRR_008544 [Megaselia abdita]
MKLRTISQVLFLIVVLDITSAFGYRYHAHELAPDYNNRAEAKYEADVVDVQKREEISGEEKYHVPSREQFQYRNGDNYERQRDQNDAPETPALAPDNSQGLRVNSYVDEAGYEQRIAQDQSDQRMRRSIPKQKKGDKRELVKKTTHKKRKAKSSVSRRDVADLMEIENDTQTTRHVDEIEYADRQLREVQTLLEVVTTTPSQSTTGIPDESTVTAQTGIETTTTSTPEESTLDNKLKRDIEDATTVSGIPHDKEDKTTEGEPKPSKRETHFKQFHQNEKVISGKLTEGKFVADDQNVEHLQRDRRYSRFYYTQAI